METQNRMLLRPMVFDVAAASYDHDFTTHITARWLRARVWSRLDTLFMPGMRVLELGCGTGEDAVHLAKRGVQVIVSDASPRMLAAAQQKAQAAGIKLTTQLFDLNQPQSWQLDGDLDGVYSNFGVLNCTRNWGELAAWLAGKLPSGAFFAAGVMGRFCLWETLWHGAHLDWHTATRRWRGQNNATLAEGVHFSVYYPSAGELAACAADFEYKQLMGLGVFLPPSDLYTFVEKRPRLWQCLTWLERQFAPRLPWLADHYWLELERK